ncbi:MAG: flagellar FliJ family protein [Alphaproteobacteria bacterium]|jgi:flagellar FliJ protein|nr:flagellar FliJ family protein [Alphaproteobacteria bacterium]
MADLNPLIRVRKHTVEQKQKFLAELYRQADELQNHKAALQRQMKEERDALEKMNTVDMIAAFSTYVEAVKERISDIDEAMKKLETRIEIAREDMREAFAEFKKIEITQERREAEEYRAIEKKQAELLDEAAIEGYRRRVVDE